MKDSTLQTEKISFSFIEFILLMDMPSLNWIPLVKKESPVVENFVDQVQTVNTVETVFIGLAMMVAAALFSVLFIWAFQKGGSSLFITIYSLLVLAYTIKVVVLIVMIREKLSPVVFQLYIGSASAMGLIAIAFLITFGVRYNRRTEVSPGSMGPGYPSQ